MQVEFKTEELLPCLCGFKPDHYTIGYGVTPYSVFCPQCKKGFNFSRYKVTGHQENAIHFWNNHIRLRTNEELIEEYESSVQERKEIEKENFYPAKEYQWYWSVSGTNLHQKW